MTLSRVCDAHFHIFGPVKDYPPDAEALYPPPDATLASYLPLAAEMGVERFVIVQPSFYGLDNECTLDALAAIGPERARAVIEVDERHVTDEQWNAWNEAGVRALRLQTHASPDPSLISDWRERLKRTESVARSLGWSIDLLMPRWLTPEFVPELIGLNVDFTIAHIGLLSASNGVSHPDFRALLTLIGDNRGHCHVKVSGFYRLSDKSDCGDVEPMVAALVETAPERLLWGTDYPHVFTSASVKTVTQMELLERWVPDDNVRRKILMDTPARLYGFD